MCHLFKCVCIVQQYLRSFVQHCGSHKKEREKKFVIQILSDRMIADGHIKATFGMHKKGVRDRRKCLFLLLSNCLSYALPTVTLITQQTTTKMEFRPTCPVSSKFRQPRLVTMHISSPWKFHPKCVAYNNESRSRSQVINSNCKQWRN